MATSVRRAGNRGIRKSGVRGKFEDAGDHAVVSSIYGMAHACGKKTIAEFVERHEKAALLQEKGVDFGLGH
ncbi:MAG: hypothetical protein AMJ72_10115 [Acidithiobacillales bacterium SM1_46]|nr:MAG: hypothetical protein AMJ72_10115 [Acidithiobacillales bacterium SM1_46]